MEMELEYVERALKPQQMQLVCLKPNSTTFSILLLAVGFGVAIKLQQMKLVGLTPNPMTFTSSPSPPCMVWVKGI